MDSRRGKRKLQLEIVDVDSELEIIANLYPETKPAIDRARDLLGRYSHSIRGVDVAQLCSDDCDNVVDMEEVAT